MEILDSIMLLELAVLTSCIFIAVLTWAVIDKKQEQKLISKIENEQHHTSNSRHHA